MENERRLAGRIVFNEVAELYDRIRPGYPDELFDDLFTLGDIAEHASVLEVGPGTGQATRSLLSRGCSVLGIELGEHMAAQLQGNLKSFPGLRVVNADFEHWDSAGERFDLIFASSAWH